MTEHTDYLDDLRDCQARVAALTASRDAAVNAMFLWSQRVVRLQDQVAALTAAIEAYHAKFQVVATCTDGDVDGHIREQMALHAVMLKLARTPLDAGGGP